MSEVLIREDEDIGDELIGDEQFMGGEIDFRESE